MPPSQAGWWEFFVRSAFIALLKCERCSSRRDCLSRRSKHSPGADGLRPLERNELESLLFLILGRCDQEKHRAASFVPHFGILVQHFLRRLRFRNLRNGEASVK